MITPQDIQKLRELPIEGVAERLGIKVMRHKALCPFHDDTTPSLTFYHAKNMYRCFVCDAHGSTIDLVVNKLGMNFPKACRWLADEENVIIDEKANEFSHQSTLTSNPFNPDRYNRFFEHPWLTDSARRFLFGERYLDERVIRWCRINSYRDKNGFNWLQTPYYDVNWNLTGVQLRNLDYQKDSLTPRFKFPRGSQCHVYNLPVLKMLKEGEPLFITEGCSDCWAMLSSGHKAIAIPSATLLKPEDVATITQHLPPDSQLHMYPDQDAPGERLYLELKEKFPSLVHHQLPEGIKDFSDYYKSNFIKK
ncbi:MAG: CHC2 zinc finger domain-containing protein [Prevotellaceae bacterium]|nr:CHC2 zinc finger domain-containing protein [Prevotellaceae bacterium]